MPGATARLLPCALRRHFKPSMNAAQITTQAGRCVGARGVGSNGPGPTTRPPPSLAAAARQHALAPPSLARTSGLSLTGRPLTRLTSGLVRALGAREASSSAPTTISATAAPWPARPPADRRLPVAVLSGFLGAGKTTILAALLAAAPPGTRLKVIVNDVGAVNVDAAIIAANPALKASASAADVLGLTDGCVCCSLLPDLVAALRSAASADEAARADGRPPPYECVLVESTGVSDPGARWWEEEDEEEEAEVGAPASSSSPSTFPARLASMVTVVDATTFVAGVGGALDAAGVATDRRVGEVEEEDDDSSASIADLLAAQVEGADVVVISRADVASADDLASTRALVAELNPGADVVESGLGAAPLPVALLAPTGRARAGWAARLDAAAAAKEHEHEHDHEHEHEHSHDHSHDDHHHHHHPALAHGGISSFVFSAPGIPFHPARLLAALEAEAPWRGVLRSKGWFWLATRPDQAGLWQAAGGGWRGEGAGPWGEEEEAEGGGAEAGPGGAPGQRLVFIGGTGMDRASIEGALTGALLTEAELAGGEQAWVGWEDELPAWAEVDEE